MCERKVRDDAEGLDRHAEVARIAADDAHATIATEPLAQTRNQ